MGNIKTIAILPWLRIERPYLIGDVEFRPYSADGCDILEWEHYLPTVNVIISSYRSLRGEPKNEVTIASLAGQEPFKFLSDSEVSLIGKATQLFSFAALASNDYYSALGNYANSSYFQILYQHFTLGSEHIELIVRRRDGRTSDGAYKHGEIAFSIPVQCSTLKRVSFDEGILESLEYIFRDRATEARQMMQAISLFNQANTDSDFVLPEREIVLLASAFEQLFSPCWGADKLAKKAGNKLSTYGSVKVRDSLRKCTIQFSQGREETEVRWTRFLWTVNCVNG